MASWRDTTPQPVQDDLDAVVSTALDAALSMLSKGGEFFPFGVTVDGDGGVALAATDPGLGEHPDSNSVLAKSLRRSHGQPSGLPGGSLRC